MMGWLLFALFAAVAAFALWRFGRLPRGAPELAGAALFLAMAGYAWQGRPGLAGSPREPAETQAAPDLAENSLRKAITGRFSSEGEVLEFADAFNRMGQTRASVNLISGELTRSPNNPDLWVGLGNALLLHGGGQMSPAAAFAFDRAAALAPNHPGPPFFLGLGLAQSGKLDEAGDIWRGLLARAPDNAPWKADLEARLAAIGQSPVRK